jgi:branched-chain amino acid transport system permease protein
VGFLTDPVFQQQLINGLTNGLIIALIALGYTMVFGIVELINFAHGDLFMLGGFKALTILSILAGLGLIIPESSAFSLISVSILLILLIFVPIFCACINYLVDRLVYKPIRNAPKLTALVSAIGVSFILLNIGLFWGGLPLELFSDGKSASAPKDFPALLPFDSLLGADADLFFTARDLLVYLVTIPALVALTCFVKFTKIGKAMRAVAQSPFAAQLVGIKPDRIISVTFMLGGALAGLASVIHTQLFNSISFGMGFRAGLDAFTAAVLGGIGSLPGAFIGGLLIGVFRAFSDQYISTQWTNAVVFGLLIVVLIFRPGGVMGVNLREKV